MPTYLLLAALSSLWATLGAAYAGTLVALGEIGIEPALVSCAVGLAAGAWVRFGIARRRSSLRFRAFARRVLPGATWVVASTVGATLVARAVFAIAPTAAITPSSTFALPVVTGVVAIWLVPMLVTYRGRRLLRSACTRLMNWEFWPPWLFYVPLFVYVGWLMVKYRSVTLFTAANPAMPAGGLIGESKFTILRQLDGAREYVARSRLIPGHVSAIDKFEIVRRFQAEEGIALPLVLKPDQGQRGAGVVIVHSAEALEDAIARSTVDTLVQEYVPGREFGIFYGRLPSDRTGGILSVTEKIFPLVVGDGVRTLEELILEDERAAHSALLYLDRYCAKLADVPPVGQAVNLVDVGTHSRGALFLNGRYVLTPALKARLDTIAHSFGEFYFGVFDVRVCGGLEAFRNGTGFKIIALNGVRSEAAHVYQPGTPLMHAYAVLMAQWQLAFEIGAENYWRGYTPTNIKSLAAMTWAYYRTARRHLKSSAFA